MRKTNRLLVLSLALLSFAAPSLAQDFLVGSTFDLFFTTRRFSTGAPFTLAGTPAVSAYEDNSTTEITAGITLTVDFDTRTGLNHLRIVATGANGYEAGKSYALVVTAGTVDSVSVVGETIGHFTLERSALVNDAITAAKIAASAIGSSEAPNLDAAITSRLAPTTAGRTLDVTATGEAGLDLDNTAGGLAKGTEITGFNDLSAAQVNAEVDTALDTAIPGSPTADSINDRLRNLDDFWIVRRNTAQAGAATTITLDTGASATDDFYNEMWIRTVSGTGPDQLRTITDYVGSTKVATITPNWLTNPSSDTVFIVVSIGRNDGLSAGSTDWSSSERNQIRQALGVDGTKAATSGGNLDAVLDDTGTSGVVLVNDAITAAKVATDASIEFRAIITGTSDSGSTTTMVDAALTQGDTDYWKDDAILFTSGTIAGQTRLITAFNAATDTITFSPATTQAVSTQTYAIVHNVAAAGASAPSAAENADAVWDELVADHVGAGSTGERVERLDLIASGGTGGLTNARAVLLDNLDAAVTSRLAPTTAGRTLDVTATGEAGLDLDNTAGGLAKGTELTGFNDLSAPAVNAEVDQALVDARLDELLIADSDIDGAAPPTVGSVFHEALTKTAGSFTYDQTTDSPEAIRDNMGTPQTGDSFARLGAPVGASLSVDLQDVESKVDDLEPRVGTPANLGGGATVAFNLSDIEGQTDDVGAAGAGLTAIPSTDIVKNAALSDFEFLMVDSVDHITPKTGLTVTGQRSCDGAAFAGVSGTIAEVGSGVYQFDAVAADTNCNIATWKFAGTGADTFYVTFRTRP